MLAGRKMVNRGSVRILMTLGLMFGKFRVGACRPLHIEVVIFGTTTVTSTTSLTFVAPAIITALEEFGKFEYVDLLNFSSKFLFDQSVSDGDDNSDNMVSEWYYCQRSEAADMAVIVLPGMTSSIPQGS
jgi:hypothetical protein